MADARTLYLVISGASTPEPVDALARVLRDDGWTLAVFSTEMGERFHDFDQLAEITGSPVRTRFRMPGTGERVQPADVVLACPWSFNSVNKLAQGIADNMALALLCEMIGHGVPTVVVPKGNPALFAHPAFATSLATLRAMPSVTVVYAPEVVAERRIPPWREVAETARAAAARHR